MRNYILLLTILVSTWDLFGQKPPIDSTVYNQTGSRRWPMVSNGLLSNDGKYAMYTISKDQNIRETVVAQSTLGKWKREFSKLESYCFTSDNRILLVNIHDSIFLFTPGTDRIDCIAGSLHWAFLKTGGYVEWLLYQEKGINGDLVLFHIATNKKKKYSAIKRYWFTDKGKTIILEKNLKNNQSDSLALQYVSLADGKITEIWKGSGANNIQFDVVNEQRLVFEVKNAHEHSWWYYQTGKPGALLLANNNVTGIPEGLTLGHFLRFSADGSRAFFMLKKNAEPLKPVPGAVRLNVWSYFDSKLQSNQLSELNNNVPKEYLGVLFLNTNRVFQLQYENEETTLANGQDDYLVTTTNSGGDPLEKYWNIKSKKSYFLLSVSERTKKLLRDGYSNLGVSPTGKFILFYDTQENQYLSYEIASGLYRLVSSKIPWPLSSTLNIRYDALGGYGVCGWMKNDSAFLIYDQYDIWQIDPLGGKDPVCLTGGYGRKNKIVLRTIVTDYFQEQIFKYGDELTLRGYSYVNKENGLWRIRIITKGESPELITKGPYIYYCPEKGLGSVGVIPVKARDAEVYLVSRESGEEYPNFFIVRNKINIPLSNLQPQKEINWYTKELHNWKSLDGKEDLQGILYKPENFDSSRKYPILFYYYELLSDKLNSFEMPELSHGDLNISWYVSNGYLVFTPDVHFQIGEPMRSSYNCIISAAHYVAGLPFVNSTKMGIQGISFGGMQTNYLVTHTNLFTAACSASAPSDFISYYGSLGHDNSSAQSYLEYGQTRIGSTIWERPDWYIKNSPVFSANKVTTPLLMMHTSVDEAFPFAQALELFTDLRRLGKKVWLLEYQDGNHSLWDKSAEDFTIRMAQFFDHYLKDKPAPKWMVEGIPAKMKGVIDGLELEPEGVNPGRALLNNTGN